MEEKNLTGRALKLICICFMLFVISLTQLPASGLSGSLSSLALGRDSFW